MPPFVLLEVLVAAVATMRHFQRQITPGAPRELREEVKRWEKEVDELIALHQLPPVDAPAAKGGDQ